MLRYLVGVGIAYVLWRIVKSTSSPKSHLDNIPGPPASSLIVGHMLQLYDKKGWDFHRMLRTKYASVVRLQTLFGQPLLYVHDPAALQTIVLKEQPNHAALFEELEWFMHIALDSFGPGLVSTTGETHRKQRKMLGPVFSPKNLRLVTPVFHEVAHRLSKAIKAAIATDRQEVDVAKYMGRAALELVGKSMLGHCFDPLTEESHHPYAEALKSYVPALATLIDLVQVYRFARPLIPVPLRRPIMNLIPLRRVQEFLRVIDTMHDNAQRIYTEKKAQALSQEKTYDDEQAKDLMTLLLHANAGASEEDALPDAELIAQLSVLLFAATDTTSSALTRMLECLANNPEAQDKLRAELIEAKDRHEGGDLPYDELLSLPYLHAVCTETLRLHAPAPMRLREAQTDTILPLSTPIQGVDGTLLAFIPIPKGTLVFAAIQAANVNSAVWGADADAWRPERWLAPLPATITDAKIPGVYSHLMTFWGGGRSCVGFKFAELEMKVVLAELISTFKFEQTDAPVVWNLAEVVYPTVGTDSWHPEYPMKVTLAQ